MQKRFTIGTFDWADQHVAAPANFEAGVYEALLGTHPSSVATYFSEVTFGYLDIRTGSVVRDRATLGVDHQLVLVGGQLQSRATREQVFNATRNHYVSISHVPPFPWVSVMSLPPSPAGSYGAAGMCVLDFAATFDYMAHEIAHAVGWEHSWSDTGTEYGDPYCITSAQRYNGHNPTHTRERPVLTQIPTDGLSPNFWSGGFGPMPAAATLFRQLPEFAASTMVTRVAVGQRTRIRALSEARHGEAVLAVAEVGGEDWMAEFRVASNWDRGIEGDGGPGPGVVIHRIQRSPATPRRVVYMGRLDVRNPLNTSLLPAGSTRTKLVAHYYDPRTQTVEVSFTDGPPPYSIGGPAPELTTSYDPRCAPLASAVDVAPASAYESAAGGSGGRVRFHVTVTDAAGRERTARSLAPRRDASTGGITMEADECRNGQHVGRWTVGLVKLDLGFSVSYLYRIDGPGLDGVVGSVWGAQWSSGGAPPTVRMTASRVAAIH